MMSLLPIGPGDMMPDRDPDWIGHKFDTELDERVYLLTLDGTNDDIWIPQEGESCQIVRFSVDDLIRLRIVQFADELAFRYDAVGNRHPILPAGALVWEDDRGFVTVDYYATAEALDEKITNVERRITESLNDACTEQGCRPCRVCDSFDCGGCADLTSGSSHIIGCARDWIG